MKKKIITELRTCLVTGYQLHVRTFTLHTVLRAVADSYTPPNPPSVDTRSSASPPLSSTVGNSADEAATASTSSGSGVVETVAMEVEEEENRAAVESATGSSGVVPAVPSSLVRPTFDACIPEIVELLMEDLFGETAAAKEVL